MATGAKSAHRFTRDKLVAPKTQEVVLDGGTVEIRALSAGEAFEYRGKEMGAEEIFGLLAASIIDPKLTIEDVRALPVATVNKIVIAVFAFNALGEKAVDDAAEELKKTPPGASASNSP